MDEKKQETHKAVEIFNRLDDNLRDKLLNGVKCLVFLQDLADVKDDDATAAKSQATQPT